MLLIALVPTLSDQWAILSPISQWDSSEKTSYGAPASCFWGTLWGDGVNPDAVISFLILAVSYIWKVGGLFSPVTSAFAKRFRDPLDRLMERILAAMALRIAKRQRRLDLWMFRVCLSVYLPITATLEALGSFSAALWLSTLGFIYGVMQIVIPRMLVQSVDSNLAERERLLTFGQLVPLILLIQPIGALTEHIWLVQEENERVYKIDRETKYSFSPSSSHAGLHLLQFLTTYTVPRSSEAIQRRQLRALLYSSKLFHSLIWLLQAAIVGTAIVVFYEDYLTIGFTTAGSWYFVSFAVAGYLGGSVVLVMTVSAFSCLGRFERWGGEFEMAERRETEEVREGMK